MFKRRVDFVMQMDVEVEHTFDERLAVVATREGASRDAVLAYSMRSVVGLRSPKRILAASLTGSDGTHRTRVDSQLRQKLEARFANRLRAEGEPS